MKFGSEVSIDHLDRPWDKSTRAVVYELPDVVSPAGLFDRERHQYSNHVSLQKSRVDNCKDLIPIHHRHSNPR